MTSNLIGVVLLVALTVLLIATIFSSYMGYFDVPTLDLSGLSGHGVTWCRSLNNSCRIVP